MVGRGTTIRGETVGAHYQSSLRPNWIWREVVEVLVMAPAVGLTPDGVKATPLGGCKFARFSRLKISARNCRLRPSRMGVSLKVEKCQVARPGPMRVLRPTLP